MGGAAITVHRAPSWGAALLFTACLLAGWAHVVGGAPLFTKSHQSSSPLSNAVPVQPARRAAFQRALNDSSALVIQLDMGIRLSGPQFVPYRLEDQQIIVDSFNWTVTESTVLTFTSYKEVVLEPALDGLRAHGPAVELAYTYHFVINITGLVINESAWRVLAQDFLHSWTDWSAQMVTVWPGMEPPAIIYTNWYIGLNGLRGPNEVHPITAKRVTLALQLMDGSGLLVVDHASAVAAPIRAAVEQRIGTLVEVVDYGSYDTLVGHVTIKRSASTAGHGHLQQQQAVLLDVTMLTCRDNATVPSPECEDQVLAAVLSSVLESTDVRKDWLDIGITNVEVLEIAPRLPPPVPRDGSPTVTETWVPANMDRIDQRTLPLDGKFASTADGTGVNVYILSSGVMGKHVEFESMDGTGSRVRPAWGYQGLNPLSDCDDAYVWLGLGTAAASTCCGLQLGVAKNATIHSVRFRDVCSINPSYWTDGGLSAALDTVLSTFVLPAVVLIDAWWYPGQITDLTNGTIVQELRSRLDLLQAANITVVSPAGPGLGLFSPCDNIVSNHPGVISVAATGGYDQVIGTDTLDCVDLMAPSGGLGDTLIQAHPIGPANYTRAITGGRGAAALVAGVAAQYLQLHPQAGSDEVRRALLKTSTQHQVTGPVTATPGVLVFTNMNQTAVQPTSPAADESSSGKSGGSGFSVGAVVGIAVATAVGAVAVIAGMACVMHKRRQQKAGNGGDGKRTASQDWGIKPEDIRISCHPDGSEWLLSQSSHWRVYKGLKGGVQAVTIRKLVNEDAELRAKLGKELDEIKLVSRDANITQLYGACYKDGSVLLVEEYMEGGDLHTALHSSEGSELQWYKRGKEVILDAVRGLHHLHAHNTVHCSISSKNILLGRDGCAKLSNVGLAALFGGSDPEWASAEAWTAPELLSGGEVTAKVDIYSLGIVLWELTTLCPPPAPGGQLANPEVPRQCPMAVVDTIRACTEHDPALRPTAKELYQLLLSCLPTPPRRSPPVTSNSGSELSASVSSSTYLGSRLVASPVTSSLIDFARLSFCDGGPNGPLKLGSGSYGAVYKVLLDGEQLLAAKEIELGRDPYVQLSFVQEAEILSQLRHPHIVEFAGLSISKGKGYLLMELMEGGSLHSILDRDRESRQHEAGWYNKGSMIALEVAKGLAFCHSMKTTHFDLKSMNVLLTKSGTAKLADVGLARVMTRTHHSLGANPVGTFAYMAPELLAGTKCTESVDIFSFGIVLWEICTGKHPKIGQRLQLHPPGDCPNAVAQLFQECTSSEASLRPTAAQLVERLALLQAELGG